MSVPNQPMPSPFSNGIRILLIVPFNKQTKCWPSFPFALHTIYAISYYCIANISISYHMTSFYSFIPIIIIKMTQLSLLKLQQSMFHWFICVMVILFACLLIILIHPVHHSTPPTHRHHCHII